MSHSPKQCSGPVTRRGFLEMGSLALGGLALSDLLRLRAEAKQAGTKVDEETSVILIWLPGGPSHLETFDLKPEAPVEYRGDFRPIHTNVPGIDICEHLPQLAKSADKYTLIRSISHGFANHAAGSGRFLTGRKPRLKLAKESQYPAIGPIVSKMREDRNIGLPNYIASMNHIYGSGSAYLGESCLPFVVSDNPNKENFQVKNISIDPRLANRLEDRKRLLKALDRMRRDVDRSGSMDSLDKFNQQAINMLTSDRARNAFDLSKEDEKTRDRYGRHQWGQRALLARRLVEAGASFVTMQMENVIGEAPGAKIGNWDDHAVNGHIFDEMRYRLPYLDQSVAALIEDIYARGLDKKVMVIVSGEFGRTPRVNSKKGTRNGTLQPGRDHWPSAMSVLVSGGNLKVGQVIGSTTSNGAYAKDNKYDPNALLSTVYRFLGIDQHHAFLDHSGRPMTILPHGEPIRELS